MQYCSNQLIQKQKPAENRKVLQISRLFCSFRILVLGSSFRSIWLVTISQSSRTNDRQRHQDLERYKLCRSNARQQRKQQP